VPRLSDQTQHSKPIVGLPTQIANDKGRLSLPTVVEGLGSCPETGFWEIARNESPIWTDGRQCGSNP